MAGFTMQRIHYMPVKNSLLCMTRTELEKAIEDGEYCRRYSIVNGFEQSAIDHKRNNEFYAYLAERSI